MKENEYGEMEKRHHRQYITSVSLYPGTLINTRPPDWIKGSSRALDLRGNNTTGWAMAHRMNLRARTREAEKAREVYSKFIKERTLPNLWTVHPPFQIDGNFGTMAGVAEMLLQSHEGYIEPLAALPEAWHKGEFRGLIARGNFEISAKWENGKASCFNILSRNGGKCIIKYSDIENAKVKDGNGKRISVSVKDDNKIEFNTRKSIEYIYYFLAGYILKGKTGNMNFFHFDLYISPTAVRRYQCMACCRSIII